MRGWAVLGLLVTAACGATMDKEARIAALEAELADLRGPSALPTAQAPATPAQIKAYIDAQIAAVRAEAAQIEQRSVANSQAVGQLQGAVAGVTQDVADVAQLTTGHIAATADLLALVTADAATGELVIEGANLVLRSGEGATDAVTNGLGNLILGYGENTQVIGSHNVVIGRDHVVQGYAGLAQGAAAVIGDRGVGLGAGDVAVVADDVEVAATNVAIDGQGSTDVTGASVRVEAAGQNVIRGAIVLIN